MQKNVPISTSALLESEHHYDNGYKIRPVFNGDNRYYIDFLQKIHPIQHPIHRPFRGQADIGLAMGLSWYVLL